MIFILCVIVFIALTTIFHASIVLFLAAVGFQILNLGIIQYVHAHPWQALLYAAGYFIVGAVWSIFKWWFIQTALRRKAEARFNDRTDKSITWESYSKGWKGKEDDETYLTLIIAFWPISLAFTLLDDPVRRIYMELRGVYDRITEYVWK
jgi:energy-coupling factor transporter transmembrane protein EcfT